MKKTLMTLALGAILTTIASADFARIEMGIGAWIQTPSGDITYADSGVTGSDTSKKNEESQAYVWALVKHPVPIIPNLRLEYVGVKSEGEATGTFKNFTAVAGDTSLEIIQYDIIPYYNLLDNTFWLTLDLGVDLKVMNITYEAPSTVGSYSSTESVALPLVYLRTRVEIPMTELGFEADVKYISYNSNTMYDVRVKVDYTFDITPVIQPGIEIGYRIQHIETDESEDAQIDMNFAGIYAGLMMRF